MKLRYININTEYKTIKDVVKNEFNISHRLTTKIKFDNKILLNDLPCSINDSININDEIVIDLDYEEDNTNIVSLNFPLDILYEDDWFLIVNKPPKIAVHPSSQHFSTSLSSAVKFYFDSINLKKKIRIVNRLDMDTSGVVIFAKNEYIQECLIKQMQENIFSKEYISVIDGILKCKEGTINEPIARKEFSIIERCVSINGDPSITHYKVLEEHDTFSIVHFKLETGRTHQIRVHSSYIGHPILGDTLYGSESNLVNRQALHSFRVKFIHPVFHNTLNILAPIPEDIANLISDKLLSEINKKEED